MKMKMFTSKHWVARNPMKVNAPQAEKWKKLWSKLRFKRYLPEPELDDILLWYRVR